MQRSIAKPPVQESHLEIDLKGLYADLPEAQVLSAIDLITSGKAITVQAIIDQMGIRLYALQKSLEEVQKVWIKTAEPMAQIQTGEKTMVLTEGLDLYSVLKPGDLIFLENEAEGSVDAVVEKIHPFVELEDAMTQDILEKVVPGKHHKSAKHVACRHLKEEFIRRLGGLVAIEFKVLRLRNPFSIF